MAKNKTLFLDLEVNSLILSLVRTDVGEMTPSAPRLSYAPVVCTVHFGDIVRFGLPNKSSLDLLKTLSRGMLSRAIGVL